ncbi:TetR/AcrR family transcriptional regulator [Streptosporangium sp. CA-135522]|uniref:TetR/AcrR family transcriptional regulator n=1 Tax=Streptosporangium sp. CA-135522 TaxID=3240072 RepID=UPI003D94E8A2
MVARRPAPGTRERILDVAARLFGERGVRAVGMQQVVDETGLGKSLLYREFPGKDDLVAAWLRESDAQWWQAVDNVTGRHAGDPARQLLAIVELAHERVLSPGFQGCTFYNTSAEFRDPVHPGRQEAVAHLQRMRERFRTLARGAGAAEPDRLADTLMLVIAGLYANGAALGPDGPADLAVSTAKAVIDQHLAETP